MAPDVAAIVARGELVVAMTSFDTPPFYSGVGDEMVGVDVALAYEIGEALGVPVTFNREAESFDAAVAKVVAGEADLAVSKISRTRPRARAVAFSDPYLTLRHALVFSRLSLAQISEGRDIASVVRSFEGSIGVLANSAYEPFAKEHFRKARIVPFETWDEAVDAVIAGTIDAAYRDEFEARKLLIDRPHASINLRSVTIDDAVSAISVVVPWDRPRLLGIVNQVIDERPAELTADELIELYRLPDGPSESD